MRVRAQTVGKEEPVYPENEDAFRLATDNTGWAVADGAGGGGIYAGEWATHLVNNVPAEPLTPFHDFSAWLDSIWEPFFETYQQQATPDALRLNKFLSEGSYATLATLHLTSNHAHWTTYGDAVALTWHPKTGLRSSVADLRMFASAPYLLNWNTNPQPEGFRTGHWPCRRDQRFALLSDTLAQYVLMAYDTLTGPSDVLRAIAREPTALGERAAMHIAHWQPQTHRFGRDVWAPLARALRSHPAFLAYTRRVAAQNLLGPDDYTMVLIDNINP